jgi:hypothetical protein
VGDRRPRPPDPGDRGAAAAAGAASASVRAPAPSAPRTADPTARRSPRSSVPRRGGGEGVRGAAGGGAGAAGSMTFAASTIRPETGQRNQQRSSGSHQDASPDHE